MADRWEEKATVVFADLRLIIGDSDCAIETIARALRRAAGEWLPIETAPRDGTEFLGLLFNGVDMAVVFCDEAPSDAPRHIWHRPDGLSYHEKALMRWRLLPAPPESDHG